MAETVLRGVHEFLVYFILHLGTSQKVCVGGGGEGGGSLGRSREVVGHEVLSLV